MEWHQWLQLIEEIRKFKQFNGFGKKKIPFKKWSQEMWLEQLKRALDKIWTDAIKQSFFFFFVVIVNISFWLGIR